MKIIDAHLHFADREGFKKTARDISEISYTARGLRSEFQEAGVIAGIVMTTMGLESRQPAGKSPEMRLEDGTLDNLLACIGINPVQLSKDPKAELYYIEKELNKPYAAGIKLYPGYSPFYVSDPLYKPVYVLAKKYGVPVAIHCGDTSSPRAQLKYSHPLTVDEVAVKYPDIDFIICHMGDPWVLDTAELISKNHNVYADMSGLIAGNAMVVHKRRHTPLFQNHFMQALVYAESYDKLLFGTDWPLVPVAPYVKFIKSLIPEEFHDDVFFYNTLKVFPRLKELLRYKD